MELKAISRCFRFCAIACLTVFGLAASEHHGLVKFGAIPVPGATVTATKGDKKAVAITDDNGAYSFPELEDGTWKLQVEMLTFQTLSKDIGVAPSAAGAEWELTMMSMDEIKPALQAAPPPTAAPAPATTAGATPPAGQAAPTPTAATAAATPAKGTPAKGKGKAGATPATPQPGFQRTEVAASAEASSLQSTPSIASADPTQTASDAMVVNGSTSNGIERRAIGNNRRGPRSLYNGGIDFTNFSTNYLNARQYSITGEDVPQSAQTNFIVNGIVQGPLWIPHVFRWQGNFRVQFSTQHSRNASNNPEFMPTEAERDGDFSQVTNKAGSPITVIDPSNGQPFPGGIIPAGRISPQANYLLHFYPLPQFTSNGQAYNFDAPTITRSHGNRLTVGINKSLPTKNRDTLNVSFTYAESSGSNDNIFGFKDLNNANNYNVTTGYNHQFTRSLRGSLNVNYNRSAPRNTPYFANVSNISGVAGIKGNDQTPIDWGPPSINFGGGNGFASLYDGNPSFNRIQTTTLGASVTYYRRPHTFTIGGGFLVQDWSLYSQSNGRGGFTFTGTSTGTGFDFASFLLGLPDASNIAFGNADKYLRAPRYNAYIDDDWRVGSSFSVRWGVRWDYGSPVTEEQGRLVNLDIAPGFTGSTPVLASNPVGALTGTHYPSSLINADKHLVMPNVSFAWKPIFGGSMVVRAGYQLGFNTSVYYPIAQQMDQQAPFSKSQSLATSPANPLTLANGFPTPNGVTANTFAVDPNFKTGYAQTWTTSVTQNITASVVATATYTGIKGTRAAQEFQPNTYPTGSTVVPCPTCLPGYLYLTSNGNSTNHRGNMQIRRRFHAGLLTTFSYTYSKAIDDVGGLGGTSPNIAQNWLDLAAERGLSTFDQRHSFNALFQYSTGVGVRGGALLGGWRGRLIKGWTITSNITVGSGLPFSPTLAGVTSGTGLPGTLRPEYIGGDVYAGAPGRFLNAAAYAAPLPGQWGNAGRDSLIGPGQFSMTGSMARSFADHLSLTLNATNPINHPVFTGYNNTFSPTVLNGGNFGQLSGATTGMRKVQATLRWTF